jgi:hypothetical protein
MTATHAAPNLVREHLLALHIGSEVTQWFRKEREPQVLKVTPENVIAALHQVGINPVLMGTHGINVYRDEPRATQDVDVLVIKRHVRKAIRAMEEAFPDLEVVESSVVARFVDPVTQKVVLDVMKPSSHAMQSVFRHTIAIRDTHRIPTLEMALVSKFLAMTAPVRREDKKLIDMGDFTNIVKQNRGAVDLDKLRQLGDKVRLGDGKRILKLIADIDAGRRISLD